MLQPSPEETQNSREKARSQTASAGTTVSTDLTQVHPKARTVGVGT